VKCPGTVLKLVKNKNENICFVEPEENRLLENQTVYKKIILKYLLNKYLVMCGLITIVTMGADAGFLSMQ
jgi:hypothetical protein